MPVGGYHTYQRIQAETASPAQLVLRLYETLARDLERALVALDGAHPIEESHTHLVHAQEVVMELLACVDLGSGDLARGLSDLYQYMYQRLVHANVAKDSAAVAEVARLLRPIHEAWAVATQASLMSSQLAA